MGLYVLKGKFFKFGFIGHLRWDELGVAEFNKFCRWQNLAP